MSSSIRAHDPRSGVVDFVFERPSAATLRASCERLRAGQGAWQALGIHGRLAALAELVAAVERHRPALEAALTKDTGRAILPAMEIGYLGAVVGLVGALADRFVELSAATPSLTPPILGREQLVPQGLVLCISPWNFPMILSLIDAIPALAAGNAVLIKPSEVTPRWVEPMRAAIREVPAVAAVFDLVLGDGATGAALIAHADAVAFTGSVRTGRKVAVAAAERFIPCFLELGGNDPAIVLASADVGYAASAIMCSALSASGQACQSLERAYVARPIFDAFVAALISEAGRWSINYPEIDGGTLGPFISPVQAEIVASHLRDAVAKGATIHTGGELIEHGGKWMLPTIVTGVDQSMLITREETFGPVITVTPFDSVDEALQLANDNDYGLSGAVFAGTVDEASAVGQRLDAGAVSINDAHLTAFVHDKAHQSFALSGIGASRFGLDGLTRYVRKKALLLNPTGQAMLPSMSLFADESGDASDG